MKIKKIGVIDCGLMGSGIAHTSTRAGYITIVRESSQEFLDSGMANLFGSIEKSIACKKASEFELRQVKSNLIGTLDLNDLADCDLIVEAISEFWKLRMSFIGSWTRS